MAIDHTPFIHPEDSAALEKLKAVPLLDTVVRQYMMSPVESMLRDMNMASRIRVGPNQMPELHAVLTDVCRKLDMPVPRFFLEMNPDPDAYTGGVNEPFIILTTSAVELLPPDELVAVIAHQCGHILCNHQLYHTLFDVMQMGRGVFSVLRVGGVTTTLKWALASWVRGSDLSADRVAVHVVDDVDVVARAILRLSGVGAGVLAKVDVAQLVLQEEEYRASVESSKAGSLVQGVAVRDLERLYPAARVTELVRWRSGGTSGQEEARKQDPAAGRSGSQARPGVRERAAGLIAKVRVPWKSARAGASE